MQIHILNPHVKSLALTFALLATSFGHYTANAETLPDSVYGQELGCLAMNIYHEARGETEKGKLAVAAVTMNRVNKKYYESFDRVLTKKGKQQQAANQHQDNGKQR